MQVRLSPRYTFSSRSSPFPVARTIIIGLVLTIVVWVTVIIVGTRHSSDSSSSSSQPSTSVESHDTDVMMHIIPKQAFTYQEDHHTDQMTGEHLAGFRTGVRPATPIHRMMTSTHAPLLDLDDMAPIRILDTFTFRDTSHDRNGMIVFVCMEERDIDGIGNIIQGLEQVLLRDTLYPIAIFHLSLSRTDMHTLQSLTTTTIQFIKLQFQLPESMSSLPDIDNLIAMETRATHHGVPFMSAHIHRALSGFLYQLPIFDDYEYIMSMSSHLSCTSHELQDQMEVMMNHHMHYGNWKNVYVMNTGMEGLMSATLNFVDTFRISPTFLYDPDIMSAAQQPQLTTSSPTRSISTPSSSTPKFSRYGRAGIRYASHSRNKRLKDRMNGHDHGDDLLKFPGKASCCHTNPAIQNMNAPSHIPEHLMSTSDMLGYDISYEIISLHMIRSTAVRRYLDHLDLLNGFYTHAWPAQAIRYLTMATFVQSEQIKIFEELQHICTYQ